MADTLLTTTQVTREALRVLHQKLNFVGNINRQYDSSFANTGAKIGSQLKIRLPNEFTVRTGATASAQDVTETSETLTVATQKGVDWDFTSVDMTLSIDDFSQRYLQPAMAVLAANIEADALSMHKDVYNHVTNDGTAIAFADILNGRKSLVDNLTPFDGTNTTILNTQDNVDLVDTLKGLFQDSSQISKQYLDGMMGQTAGFKFFENTLLPRFTSGTAATTSGYLVNGASQTGATLTVDTGTATFLQGDIITIAGVNRVHPETKEDTGVLQTFVVTADSGASATSLSISPSITTSGARQNVTGSPADNAAVSTILGNAAVVDTSLQFHKDAFTFVTADLVLPQGTHMANRQVMDGISMRFVTDYNATTDVFLSRFDVLYGYKTIRPQLACRQQHN